MTHSNPSNTAGKFERALPSIVKSIRQRDLLNSWLRLEHPTPCRVRAAGRLRSGFLPTGKLA